MERERLIAAFSALDSATAQVQQEKRSVALAFIHRWLDPACFYVKTNGRQIIEHFRAHPDVEDQKAYLDGNRDLKANLFDVLNIFDAKPPVAAAKSPYPGDGGALTLLTPGSSELLDGLVPPRYFTLPPSNPCSDKGKPGKSRGHKATGPRLLRDALLTPRRSHDRRAAERIAWRPRGRTLSH